MALIKCPECNKEISDKAPACPNCGTPIANKKVKVHFHRKRSAFGALVTGVVLIDGVTVGSASNGSEFDAMLSTGTHNVIVQSKVNGALASDRSRGEMITIPDDAKSVDVELKLKQDIASSLFGSGGAVVAVGEVTVHR